MKIYKPQSSTMYVVSGVIKSVSEDKMSITVASESYNRAEKKVEPVEMTFNLNAPADEYTKENALVTVLGYDNVVDPINGITESRAAYVSTGNKSFTAQKMSVINGNLISAKYVSETNADGTPVMTKARVGADGTTIAAKPKKPHYDISVATFENDGVRDDGTPIVKKVLHIIKEYGKGDDMSKIEALKKRFASFDKDNNPMRVTVVTQPGDESVSTSEYNGKTYTNYYCNHMGVRSLDIELTKDRVAARKEAQAQYEANRNNREGDSAPAQPSPAQAPAQSAPAKAPATAPQVEEEDGDLNWFENFEGDKE